MAYRRVHIRFRPTLLEISIPLNIWTHRILKIYLQFTVSTNCNGTEKHTYQSSKRSAKEMCLKIKIK